MTYGFKTTKIMLTTNLGYPRIGSKRELKKACESFWAGKISEEELRSVAKQLRQTNWLSQQEAGIDLIPSNDFSYYDHVLDTALLVGAIPPRYASLAANQTDELALYFAMARGFQRDGLDIHAMEMTKWFDTNYHYIVPEFTKNQTFSRCSDKIVLEFEEAKALGIQTKPVLLGPVSFLLLGKEKEADFNRLDLLEKLLPVYVDILTELATKGVITIQLDEPCLTLDLNEDQQIAFQKAYQHIRQAVPNVQLVLASYFECYGNNLGVAVSLPVDVLQIDLVRCPSQLQDLLADSRLLSSSKVLSLGVVDGRNIWKNDFTNSLRIIQEAVKELGEHRVWISPSCSLLHSPIDLELEKNEAVLSTEIKNWMAFAKQKLTEVVTLAQLANEQTAPLVHEALVANKAAIQNRQKSPLIHKPEVKARVKAIQETDFERNSTFAIRQKIQKELLNLPLFPTTTIGSFPQTDEVRQLRASYKKGTISLADYEARLEDAIVDSIRWQESVGLDVLVHGEFERNDMVEYFGEQLAGYTFTQHAWVQSYGSRCVKPPIIYGDVERPVPMTVKWSSLAQSHTDKLMKGMLTGPITILQWSFVRDDQARSETAFQLALAIRDEVLDLEKAGIKIIQIDEPAIREGLPIRQENWANYLKWAVNAFKLSASGVQDSTQIHTHVCYSEFNDIIEDIARMDADVITIETSRSQMEILSSFTNFSYPNEIGPGVYDIHSPRIPSVAEITFLLEKALQVLPAQNLWVNPDCGLKTRHWEETELAILNMILATKELRKQHKTEKNVKIIE